MGRFLRFLSAGRFWSRGSKCLICVLHGPVTVFLLPSLAASPPDTAEAVRLPGDRPGWMVAVDGGGVVATGHSCLVSAGPRPLSCPSGLRSQQPPLRGPSLSGVLPLPASL